MRGELIDWFARKSGRRLFIKRNESVERYIFGLSVSRGSFLLDNVVITMGSLGWVLLKENEEAIILLKIFVHRS